MSRRRSMDLLESFAAPWGPAAQSDTEVVALDRDLVRLNTSNPPGNEAHLRSNW